MLHKYASESKWEDAVRLCRFVKVREKRNIFFQSWKILITYGIPKHRDEFHGHFR